MFSSSLGKFTRSGSCKCFANVMPWLLICPKLATHHGYEHVNLFLHMTSSHFLLLRGFVFWWASWTTCFILSGFSVSIVWKPNIEDSWCINMDFTLTNWASQLWRCCPGKEASVLSWLPKKSPYSVMLHGQLHLGRYKPLSEENWLDS